MKAAPTFGYQVSNFTSAQVTLPYRAEMTTTQQMNPDWEFRGEDDALHFNDKGLPALGPIPGTYPDPSLVKHASKKLLMCLNLVRCIWLQCLNEPEVGTEKKQLQPIFMYSSCLEINKEQLNAGWKHLPVLYFIHTHKKEKETNIVHRICVFYFLSCQ